MKNWKIGTRIAAGFAAIIISSMALSVFAFRSVSYINQGTIRITQHATQGVFLVGQLQSNVLRNFNLLLQHVSAHDKAEKDAVENEIKGLRASNDSVLQQYESLLSGDKEKALYQALKAARGNSRVQFNEVMRLSQESKNKEAIALLDRELKALQRKYQEAASNLVAYNKSAADSDGRAIEATVGGARTGIIFGLLAGSGAAILIALFVVRGIVLPLRRPSA